RLTEIEELELSCAAVVEQLRDDGDRGGRAGDVREPPHLRELHETLPVRHEHEVPRLPVDRRRRAPSRLEDPVEILGGDRPAVELAHVATRPDRLPRLHPDVSTRRAARARTSTPAPPPSAGRSARRAPSTARARS